MERGIRSHGEGEFFGEGRLNGQPLALQNEMQLNVFSISIIEEIIQVNQAQHRAAERQCQYSSSSESGSTSGQKTLTCYRACWRKRRATSGLLIAPMPPLSSSRNGSSNLRSKASVTRHARTCPLHHQKIRNGMAARAKWRVDRQVQVAR